MSAYRVPDHAWALILPHLQLPKPEARSAPPRSAIRQPHLCAAIRVNRVFQAIVEPLLYTHPITDDTYTFLSNFHLPSTQRLWSHTRSLRLEYLQHGEEPSIYTLFTVGKENWKLFGLTTEEREKGVLRDMCAEVKRLDQRLASVEKSTTLKALFPRLETIAVSSIYGVDTSIWEEGNWQYFESVQTRKAVKFPDNRRPCNTLNRLLRQTTITHLCSRDFYGPLAIFPITSEVSRGSKYLITHHFPENFENLPIRFGEKTRWIFDSPSTVSWNDSLSEQLLDWFNWAKNLRPCANCSVGQRKMVKHANDFVGLEVYCSTADMGLADEATIETEEEERDRRQRVIDSLGEAGQALFRGKCGLEDTVVWRATEEAPRCEACDSLPLP